MRIDGYICETCLAYSPRNYTPGWSNTPPEGWVTHQRYVGAGSPRNLHWCSIECRDAMVEIKPAAAIRTEFLTNLQGAIE